MKTCVIMQPTYLPWIGYFDLMDQSDVFVYLDSVQFDKRSWQQRNRLKGPHGEQMVTVPVLNKGKFDQKVKEAQINTESKFVDEHIKAVEWNYAKAPYFKTYFPQFQAILSKRHPLLADLNIELIEWFKTVLKIESQTLRSSTLNVIGKKTELLVDICKKVGATDYLSPAGSRVYIDENNLFPANGITLHYQQYEPVSYSQMFGPFLPYLSVLDLLMNEGEHSLSILRAGRKVAANV